MPIEKGIKEERVLLHWCWEWKMGAATVEDTGQKENENKELEYSWCRAQK